MRIVRNALFVFAVVFVVHGAIAFRGGPMMSRDSGLYDRLSTQLVQSGFDYGALQKGHYSFMLVTRFAFLTLLALAKLAAGAAWQKAIVLVNVICDAATGMLVVRLAWNVTRSLIAAWVSFLLFLGSFDIFQWNRYILSDTIFLLLAFAVISCCVGLTMTGDAKGRTRLWIAIVILFAVAMLVRPTAVALVPIALVAGFVSAAAGEAVRRRRMIAVGVVAVVAAIAFVFVEAWILQKPSRWPLRALSVPVAVAAREYGAGEVVYQRVETYHRPPRTVIDYTAITADRLVHFFQITVATNSRGHNLFNLLVFVPLYLLALIGAIGSWRSPVATAAFVLVIAVATFAFMHSVTQVDWDWRYRLPVLPPLIVLAGSGAQMVLSRLSAAVSRRPAAGTANAVAE